MLEVISDSIAPEQEALKTDVKKSLKSALTFPVIVITAGVIFYAMFGLSSRRISMSGINCDCGGKKNVS